MKEVGSELYRLRKVVENDMELLFEWANNKEVRVNSINTKKILFSEHVDWFRNKQASSQCKMFILELEKEPVGQVRFDYDTIEKVWVINYSVTEKFRGKGLAKLLLAEAFKAHNQYPVVGYVKENNKRSSAVFISMGFVDQGANLIEGTNVIKYFKNSVS